MAADADPRTLDDDTLRRRTETLLDRSRRTEAELVRHLAEVDARKLYAEDACPSTFDWCVRRLGMSQSAAGRRIRVARLSRQLPQVLDRLARGEVHLCGLTALAPYLSEDNADELLAAAHGRTKEGIEAMLAERLPARPRRALLQRVPASEARRKPAGNERNERRSAPATDHGGARRDDAGSAPRAVGVPSTAGSGPNSDKPSRIEAAGPQRFRLHLDVDERFVRALERVRELASHRRSGTSRKELLTEALELLGDRLKMPRTNAVERAHAPVREGTRREARGTIPRIAGAAISPRSAGRGRPS